MAKIILPDNEPGRSGKMDGIIFSRNRYGSYIKPYVKPINPRTAEQMEVRERMRIISELWKSLEYWQVAEWEEAVHFHQIRSKSGKGLLTAYSFFTRTNLNLMKIDCEPTRICPIELKKPMELDVVNVDIRCKAKREDMLLTFEPNLDRNSVILLSATRQRRGYTFPKQSDFRKLGVIDSKWNPGAKGSSIMKIYMDRFWEKPEEGYVVVFKFQVVEKTSGMEGMTIYCMEKGHV